MRGAERSCVEAAMLTANKASRTLARRDVKEGYTIMVVEDSEERSKGQVIERLAYLLD